MSTHIMTRENDKCEETSKGERWIVKKKRWKEVAKIRKERRKAISRINLVPVLELPCGCTAQLRCFRWYWSCGIEERGERGFNVLWVLFVLFCCCFWLVLDSPLRLPWPRRPHRHPSWTCERKLSQHREESEHRQYRYHLTAKKERNKKTNI